MRKRFKSKVRCCAMCKPHKRKWSKRWKLKDMARLRDFEKMRKEPGLIGEL